MTSTSLFFFVIAFSMACPLRAVPADTPENDQLQESAYLKKHEKKLEKMQAERSSDTAHALQAQETYRKDTAEMAGHADQKARDIQSLKSAETQVTAGQKQKMLAHETYKESVGNYGSKDPRSDAALKNWTASKETQTALIENRQLLKTNIQQGGRQVHNDKILLGVQKRTMDSNARYRANDDRDIKNEEKTILDNRNAMTQVVQSSEPAHF